MNHHRHRAVACLITLAATAPGQSLLHERYALEDANLGAAVAGGADFDQDGYDDVVAGAPWATRGGQTVGAAYVISGADGTLLFTTLGDADGDRFGSSVAVVGDVNGDTFADLVVGAPYSDAAGSLAGMVRVFSGKDWKILYTLYGAKPGDEFGSAVAGGFDQDGDGWPDIAVGAPGARIPPSSGDFGGVRTFSGRSGEQLGQLTGLTPGARYGETLCTSGDFDGDGRRDIAFGGPDSDEVCVFRVAGGPLLLTTVFGIPDTGFGAALDAGLDVDSDGRSELLVGAPRADAAGLVGAGEVYLFDVAGLELVRKWSGEAVLDRFGTSVAVLGGALGSPGVEICVGALERNSNSPGSVRVFSAGSPNERYRVEGARWSELGRSVAAAGDFNADGFPDFVAGAPEATNPFPPAVYEAGLVRVFSGGGPGIVAYCTAGVSASGCRATLGATGVPQAKAGSGFRLVATGVEGNKPGLYFFGVGGRQATAWGNGTSLRCVAPPVKRAGLLAGTGDSGKCDGSFDQDLNALWCPTCPKPNHNPGPGAVVQAQLWYRDPQNSSNQSTSLSNAVEFVVGP